MQNQTQGLVVSYVHNILISHWAANLLICWRYRGNDTDKCITGSPVILLYTGSSWASRMQGMSLPSTQLDIFGHISISLFWTFLVLWWHNGFHSYGYLIILFQTNIVPLTLMALALTFQIDPQNSPFLVAMATNLVSMVMGTQQSFYHPRLDL